jgi:hypothetical protein
VYAVCNAEGCGGLGRNVRCQIVGVDDAAAIRHSEMPSRQPRNPASPAEVLAVGVEGDLAAGDHALQYACVVGHDVWRGGPLVHARLRAVGLPLAFAQRGRDHAIELGCLMQPDERIGVEPVTAGAVAAVE